MRHPIAALAALTITACAPEVQIHGTVAVQAPDCVATADSPAQQLGTLDIGFDANDAFPYTAAFIVSTAATDVTYDAIEVYYTTDADREGELQLQNDGTPINELTARRTSISATSSSEVVLAQIITEADALALAAEPFVAEALVDTDSRVRIIAHAKVSGSTSTGAAVESQELGFPVELCRGCLVPVCDVGEQPRTDGCFLGQDTAAFCVAE